VYGASKHAVIGLTRSLAQEVQPHGIRVTALCPMPANTEMRQEQFPDKDLSSYLPPEEIAEAAVFMATRSFAAGIQELIVGLNRRWGGIG
jgi:NAD(P)-dependent dehydrogenase (short-subunit alcohol dehydrogenase family)